ncbi:unnamed protein product, partial [Phaeothamnion confervicola]
PRRVLLAAPLAEGLARDMAAASSGKNSSRYVQGRTRQPESTTKNSYTSSPEGIRDA